MKKDGTSPRIFCAYPRCPFYADLKGINKRTGKKEYRRFCKKHWKEHKKNKGNDYGHISL